jgi:hypothetical protein
VLVPNHSGGLTLWPDLARDRFELMADLLLHALAMALATGWEIPAGLHAVCSHVVAGVRISLAAPL